MRRVLNTSVILVLLAAAALAGAGAGHAATSTRTLNLGPLGADLRWVAGPPEWMPNCKNRLLRSVFQFRAGGGFTMFQPDGYPALNGSFAANGNTIVFRGTAHIAGAYSGAINVEVQGQLDSSETIHLWYVSGSTLAAVFSNLGGDGGATTRYGLSKVKAYTAAVRVQPL